MRLFLTLLILLLPQNAAAQLEANFRNGGGIIIGESTTECTADAKGALRYNDTSKRFEGCNGTDGWNPLAQSSRQLGTPLYANHYSTSSPAVYNSDLEEGIRALYNNDTASPAYIYWRGQCLLDGSGTTITPANLAHDCGKFLCLDKMGQWPYMAQIAGYCVNGGDSSCNGGSFTFTWNCLTTQ